ncbi:MAG: isochorismate synthase [Chloroflexi bacterium]|nr:isochorismate synthase [Chloroflexota bacterium]
MTAVLEEATLQQSLRRALASGAREAAERDEPVLVSVGTPIPAVDPVALFEAARAAAEEVAFWEQPDEQFSLVAVGTASQLTGHGDDRFDQVVTAWRDLVAGAVIEAADACPIPSPVCLGGFAFDPDGRSDDAWRGYPDALITVPRYLVVSEGGSSWLITNALAGPDDDSDAEADATLADLGSLLARADGAASADVESNGAVAVVEDVAQTRWQETVADIVGDIRSGAIRKLVLARQVRAQVSEPPAWSAALRRLRARYGGCTVFAFTRDTSCFLGATPERLVRLDGRDVRIDCLAGSAPRGATEIADRTLGEALINDEKERLEHALVVDSLRETLQPLCSVLDVPERPRLLRMPNVQHLHTPVAGTLSDDRHVLDLVARLHPTPASGGVPQQVARSLIRSYESFDRGWYAGPVGWIDGRGGGEFVVAIRSALLREQEALLYAGCGIVAGSNPEREYQESCLKLEPMLWAMNGKGS